MSLHPLAHRLFATLLVLAAGTAQAGLVTGTADPVFGPPLTGLSYGARFEVYLPDDLRDFGDTVDLAAAGHANVRLQGEVYLFPTGTPPLALDPLNGSASGYSSGTFDFLLKSVTFDHDTGLLIDWALGCVAVPVIGSALPPCSQDMLGLSGAPLGSGLGGANFFIFDWRSLAAPMTLTCFDVPFDGHVPPETCGRLLTGGTVGQPGGLDVNYVDARDDGDTRGGVRYSFTGTRDNLVTTRTFFLPEPGPLALLAVAGLAAGWARRRRA